MSGSLLLLLLSSAQAKDVTRIEDFDLEDLLGDVSAASRREQSRLLAPASVTVLDRRRIRASGARSIPELLREVPGVRVLRNAPGSWVVAVRGVGEIVGNEVLVLLNGEPLNRQLDGAVNWNAMPFSIEQVERVEVVRGPVSPIYGANAYTGVISIVTTETSGAGVWGGADFDGGMTGELHGSVARAGRTEWSLGAMIRHDTTLIESPVLDDVWLTGSDAHPTWYTGGVVLQALTPVGPGELDSFVTTVGGQRTATEHLALAPDPQLGHRISVGTKLRLGDEADDLQGETWLTGFYNSTEVRTDDTSRFHYTDLLDDGAEVGGQLFVRASDAVDLEAGALTGVGFVQSPELDPIVEKSVLPSYAVWVGTEIGAGRWQFSLTPRIDLSKQTPRPTPSGRGALIHHRDDWSWRLTFGRSFRDPSLVELAARFEDPATGIVLLEGNPDLRPPRVESVETGGVFAIAERVQLYPNLYYQQVRNAMVQDFDSVARRTYENDHALHRFVGGEVDVTVAAGPLQLTGTGAVRSPVAMQMHMEPAIGIASMQTEYNGSLGANWVVSDQWELSTRGVYTSARTYDIRLGIPPVDLSADVPARLHGSATVGWLAPITTPLHVVGTFESSAASSDLDSIYPWAATMGPVSGSASGWGRDEAPRAVAACAHRAGLWPALQRVLARRAHVVPRSARPAGPRIPRARGAERRRAPGCHDRRGLGVRGRRVRAGAARPPAGASGCALRHPDPRGR